MIKREEWVKEGHLSINSEQVTGKARIEKKKQWNRGIVN